MSQSVTRFTLCRWVHNKTIFNPDSGENE